MAKNIFYKLKKMTSTNVGNDAEQMEHWIQCRRKGKLIKSLWKAVTSTETQHPFTLYSRSPRHISYRNTYTNFAALLVTGKT